MDGEKMKNIAIFILSLLLPIGLALAANGVKSEAEGVFSLPDLPYATDALSAAIDQETMELHHGKHHKAYVDNLNKEAKDDPVLKSKSLAEIISSVSQYSDAVRNNAGGHWNHSFYWTIMSPEQSELSKELSDAIIATFGSLDTMKMRFEEAGVKQFGSGWVWLIVKKDGTLEITTTPNQDNPLMDLAKVKGTPILGNDVWEHAYYLQYQNRRAEYLSKWWNVVNWAKVSELYSAATKK
jgi:superoxide dismutase, Fe-Mn family